MENNQILTQLQEGQTAKVIKVSASGNMRRRLLDLGVIEGTQIKCLHKSPAGDPIAYSIRGAVIALRSEDAKDIQVNNSMENENVVALAGNPNVGKSTVFNALTGMNQHTGNWPGKTVSSATGQYKYKEKVYNIVDLPGTYSLMSHSLEEEIARDFICFKNPSTVVVVCDATCLERNLNLVLQTLEITSHVVVCVNLLDEACKKNIVVDLDLLEQALGVPVVGTSARSKKGLSQLKSTIEMSIEGNYSGVIETITYGETLEKAIAHIKIVLDSMLESKINTRWTAIKLLEGDDTLCTSIKEYLGYDLKTQDEVSCAYEEAIQLLETNHICKEDIKDTMVSRIIARAEEIGKETVFEHSQCQGRFDRSLDRVLTSRLTGIPIMLLLLCGVFWLTITGANYPSDLLATGLFWIQDRLTDFFLWLGTPPWVHGALVLGIYRVLAWVVSVMLPPMAIFFPLFTLLEDFGYLPRVAFNLDYHFKKACTCGKQALTMCMGFGCNAAGVVGCRIIDSPRERLIAIITNNFVPCNGRFPTLIAIITMFFVGSISGISKSFVAAFLLTGVIILGVIMTFWVSRILSGTILKGVPSSFTLELPPYRKPQMGKVIVRSIFDRTLFVLGRSILVAAPAGLLIWVIANVSIGDMSILNHLVELLNPFAKLLGLDGVILIAFILGFPANEIVVPIIIMGYMATGTLTDISDLGQLKILLVEHGWTWATAVSTMLFCLMHWPCSTTCMTIKKETKSVKWTLISFLIPTGIGMILCFLFTSVVRIFGFLP